MKIIKKLCIVLTMLLTLVCFVKPTDTVAASEYSYPTQQFRAAWVSHFAGDVAKYQNETQYKEMMKGVLDNMQAWGMNAIIYHIRTHNNAMYDSEMNPIASWWANVNFDEFDPLTWLIEETHSRGMEFHAWMNPYRISSTGVSDLDALASTFPSNNIASNKANYLATSGGVILDPGLPEVRDFIVDTCMEVVEKYDVDAIHFDDYFYISGVNDSATRAKYNTSNLSTDNFRRLQVDLFMEQLHDEITKYNEENNAFVQLGISPSGIYRNGSYGSGTTPEYDANGTLIYPVYSNTSGFSHYGDYLYSDTKKWIDEGWIDYILPQTYWAINHTSASFSTLSEWWSWCVRNKDCNLYLGQGIYMAIEYTPTATGSYKYWGDPDEIKNQIFNMDSHKEVDGASMYKYSSLLSSNSLIKSAVSHLKTYWNKQIPGAVIKSFKDAPATEVENVILNGSTLSWEKVENVRQYVVWRVAKNQTVDTKNIEHLYTCTTQTQIEVEAGYDYYVSSVNKANVISTPTTMKKELTYKEVEELISSLPLNITLSDEKNVEAILEAYNSLSQEAKQLVSNYVILENAVNQIAALKGFEILVDEALNSINPNAGKVTLLPLYYEGVEISWTYKNASDSEYFDLSTGLKQKLILKTKLVPLLATFTKDGQSITKEFNLNVGVTKTTENGLFYRNDSGAMNKNDDPSYDSTKFIGGSGRSLVFNGYRYFLATKNDFNITSSSITKINWSSCGGFYLNTGSSNITLTVGSENLAVYNAANYGYFVIGVDNKVRYTTSEYVEGETIVLAPGEALYAVRYLDGLITGSPMKPATNIAVGTTVILENHAEAFEVSSSDVVNALIEEINSIGTDITLNQASQINRALNIYNGLNSEEQAQVTNYSSLSAAKTKLDNLSSSTEDYTAEKNAAISSIQNAITDLSIYSEANQGVIKLIINNAVNAIKNATTLDDINTIKEQALIDLEKVLTIEEEEAATLPLVKEEAISSLNSYVELNLYSQANQAKITSLIVEATSKINAATRKAVVEQVVLSTKASIDEVLTLSQELAAHKDSMITVIENYAKLSDYSSDNQNRVKVLINTAKTNVYDASTIALVDDAVSNFKSAIDAIPTLAEEAAELLKAKNEAIAKLEAAVDYSLYTDANKTIVKSKLEKYKSQINQCANVVAINTVLTTGLADIASVEKDLAAFEELKTKAILALDEFKTPELYSETNYQRVLELIDSYTKLLQEATSVSVLNSKQAEAKEALAEVETLEEELASKKLSSKQELDSYVESLEIAAGQEELVTESLNKYKSQIDKASQIEEIDSIVEVAKLELSDTAKGKDLTEYKSSQIEAIQTYINRESLSTTGKNLYDSKIAESVQAINNATSESEIDSIVSSTKLALDDIHNNYQAPQSSSCFGVRVTYIMMATLVAAALLLVFKKREN